MDDDGEAIEVYLSEMRAEPRLSAEQEADLGARMRAGDSAARGLFIRGHLRLALAIARRYRGGVVPLGDLIGEANYGLMQAVASWQGLGRFAAYARPFIRGRIMRAFRQARAVHLPNDRWVVARQIREATDSLCQSLGREPTDGELGEATGLSSALIDAIRTVLQDSVSLDYQPEDDDPPAYYLADSCDVAEEAAAVAYVEGLLVGLSRRQRCAISAYAEGWTLEEIGLDMGLTYKGVHRHLRNARESLAAVVERPAWADTATKRSYGRPNLARSVGG